MNILNIFEYIIKEKLKYKNIARNIIILLMCYNKFSFNDISEFSNDMGKYIKYIQQKLILYLYDYNNDNRLNHNEINIINSAINNTLNDSLYNKDELTYNGKTLDINKDGILDSNDLRELNELNILFNLNNNTVLNNWINSIIIWIKSEFNISTLNTDYLNNGLLFYMSNIKFKKNSDILDQSEDDIIYDDKLFLTKYELPKILRHFKFIYKNNRNQYRNYYFNDNIQNDDNIVALNGTTLEQIIKLNNDLENNVDDKYFSTIEEFNINIENVTNYFQNEVLNRHLNSDATFEKIENIFENIFTDNEDKRINSAYILTNQNIYNQQRLNKNPLNIPKKIDIPEEKLIYSELDKEEVLNLYNIKTAQNTNTLNNE